MELVHLSVLLNLNLSMINASVSLKLHPFKTLAGRTNLITQQISAENKEGLCNVTTSPPYR